MKERLSKLLELKSILSIAFCGTTCYLAVIGKISMETFMAVTMAIITYYFTRKTDEGK
jgi:hypothetical protein